VLLLRRRDAYNMNALHCCKHQSIYLADVFTFSLTVCTLIREGMGMKAVGPSEELEEVEAELGMIKKGDADEQGHLVISITRTLS
jgi:hypothetical protein